MNFENTTDESLLSLYKSKSQDMVYYHFAEGETWYRERAAREKCKQELAQMIEEIYARGLDLPKGDHFV